MSRSLSKNRNFNIFLGGQVVSAIGDSSTLVLLPILVLECTGSVAQMGLVTTTAGLGQLIGGLLAGSWVDRGDRRRLMLLCDLMRIVVYGLIPILWWLGYPAMWVLYFVAFIGGALAAIFAITEFAALPGLVERSDLTAANGRMLAGFGLALFAGTLLGGALSAWVGAATAIAVDSLTFALSALSLWFIRLGPPASETASSTTPEDRSLWSGVGFLLREPTLRAVAILMLLVILLSGGGKDLLIYHIKENLTGDDDTVGLVFSLSALGAIFGGLLASPARRKAGFGVVFLGAILAQGVAVIAMSRAGAIAAFACAAVCFACANSASRVYSMSVRQELTPDHLLGRVTSVFWVLMTAGGPVGAAGLAVLAERMGVRPVLAAMGVLMVVVGGIGVFTPARQHSPVDS